MTTAAALLRRSTGDGGSASVWTVSLLMVALVSTLAACLVGAAVAARHVAGAAADLAALAAAQLLVGSPAGTGPDVAARACATAGAVAAANGGRLLSCHVDGTTVDVAVEAAPDPAGGGVGVLARRAVAPVVHARAGPG